MKEKLSRLLCVKSIVTIILTLVTAILAYQGRIDIKDIYLIVISFYFGTQATKETVAPKE